MNLGYCHLAAPREFFRISGLELVGEDRVTVRRRRILGGGQRRMLERLGYRMWVPAVPKHRQRLFPSIWGGVARLDGLRLRRSMLRTLRT